MKIVELGNTYHYTIETEEIPINGIQRVFKIGVEVEDNKKLTIRPNAESALDFVFIDSDPATVRIIGELLIAASTLIKK
jgi:hypothetical protein